MLSNDLNDMMLFIAVVDAGSFTLAAERLNMPKANLSRKIARLEKRLGVVLLERTTRTQHITEAGERYLAHCRRIQHEVELADVSISRILNEVQGELRVGTSVGMGHEILKPVLGQFMQAHPSVNLRLDLLNRRVDLIEEGFDLVIRIGALEDSRLVAKPLGVISRRLYASPKYLNQRNKITTIDQLSDQDFLIMSSAQDINSLQLTNEDRQHTFKPHARMLIDDYSILKQMVVEGIGMAIIPDYMCQKELNDNKLVHVLPKWSMPNIDVYALYPRHRLNIPKVSAFVTFIQTVFSKKLNIQKTDRGAMT